MHKIELELEGLTIEVDDETHALLNKVANKINQLLGYNSINDDAFDFSASEVNQDRDAYQIAAMTKYCLDDMAIH